MIPLKNSERKKVSSLSTDRTKRRTSYFKKGIFFRASRHSRGRQKIRKEANQYMMKNDEEKYEEIHDRMNELKLREKNYKGKLQKKNR